MGRVIGIDLGTTNSCVAVMENGQPTVIPNAGGYKTTPSMFAISQDGKRLVGHLAKRQAITNARNTVYASKRLIGRRFDAPEVQKAIDLCPYEIVRGPNDDPRVRIGEKTFTCPELSALILREMKRVAEEHLGEPVRDAVITVPAYFNDSQRQATKNAGQIAGMNVLRIINEPTAASLAYGLEKKENETILVFDLGGEDFDRRLVAHLLERFQEAEGIDLRTDAMALQRLKDAAEKAKCDLSTRDVTEINLPFVASDARGPRHLNIEVTRETLEGLVDDIVGQTLKIVESCLHDAGLTREQIDQVVLVGGQTRMPLVQNLVTELFGKRPHKGVNPDEVVAVGAAIQGESLLSEDKNLLLLDVTPLSLGIATFGGHFAKLIERNTTVPVRKGHIFTTTRDNQSAVKIRVLQGESETASENDLLGEFVLSGIRPARKGEPEIEVSFDIDANGIVSVSARDQATGKEQSIQVNATGTLSEEEIQRIIDENELYEVQLKE